MKNLSHLYVWSLVWWVCWVSSSKNQRSLKNVNVRGYEFYKTSWPPCVNYNPRKWWAYRCQLNSHSWQLLLPKNPLITFLCIVYIKHGWFKSQALCWKEFGLILQPWIYWSIVLGITHQTLNIPRTNSHNSLAKEQWSRKSSGFSSLLLHMQLQSTIIWFIDMLEGSRNYVKH